MSARPHPQASIHSEIREIFPDIFFVTGTIGMPGPVPIRFSRNMTVIRQGGELTLVNSMRLSNDGLGALERLGKIAHVIRLAGFHGRDDPFYKDRYGAKVWAVKGQRYVSGFDQKAAPYFQADAELDEAAPLPIQGARLYLFHCDPGEALLLLDREGGICIPGDALQNWDGPDEYFNLPGKLMMRVMGFLRPCNVGPGWLRAARPSAASLRGILDLRFEHVLPAHGAPLRGNANALYRPAVLRAAGS